MEKRITALLIAALSASLLLLSACQSRPHNNPDDPYEDFNRPIYKFNTAVDKVVFRPIATGYRAVVPNQLRRGIANAYDNTRQIPYMVNDILQADLYHFQYDFWRFVINTTAGVGGLFDVAKYANLPKRQQDFGLTFAKWGVRDSPYLVIPLLGPSTTRDAAGLIAEAATLPYNYLTPLTVPYSINGANLIVIREKYLDADRLVDESFDPYIFVRDAYLQTRNNAINKMEGKSEPFNEPE